MDDRELLELAAKAAGTPGEWGEIIDIGGDKVDLTDVFFVSDFPWDPLEDDGAALRLAVNLKMDLKVGTYDAIAEGHVNGVLGYTVERIEANAESSIRRAIVRAAAEIGRAM